jgi:hypothetical protein
MEISHSCRFARHALLKAFIKRFSTGVAITTQRLAGNYSLASRQTGGRCLVIDFRPAIKLQRQAK